MTPDHDDSALRLRLPAQSDQQFAAMHEALADAPSAERPAGWFVALARQDELPDEKRLASFAEAFGIDAYTARQRLLSPAARLLLREETESAARAWVQWLAHLRLRSFLVPGDALASQRFEPCIAVFATESALVFLDSAERRTEVPLGSVGALVFGEVRERLTAERDRYSPVATTRALPDVAPAIPTQEGIADVHLRSGSLCLRLEQNSVQFSRMFPDQTGASAVLIRTLFTKLRRSVPAVPVWDGFREAEDVLGASLKFLGSDAAGSTLARHFLRTSRPTFDLYSTLARLEALQVGR